MASIFQERTFVEMSISELGPKTNDFESDLERVGSQAILEHYNTCRNILSNAQVEDKMRTKMLKTLISSFETEIGMLKELLADDSTDFEEKNQHANCIIAFCNLLCGGIKQRAQSAEKPILKRGRSRVKKNDCTTLVETVLLNYSEKYLEILIQLFSLPFHNLWHPPILDGEFLRMIVGLCFKLLSNDHLSRVKHLFHNICKLLGLILSTHDALLMVTLELLDLVKHTENQAASMSNLVHSIITNNKVPHFMVHLFKEIQHVHNNEAAHVDSTIFRNCAQFVSLLGKCLPKEVCQNSSLLMSHLEMDPYSLRNAVLDCFGQIVIQIYTKPQLDDVSRKSRDVLLDKIQEHIHDINAYVRSHVIQIWSMLASSKAIPLNRFNRITNLAVDRLNDKSCNVRKSAACLLYNLLVNNPYAPYIEIEELEKQLRAENNVFPDNSSRLNLIIQNSDADWNNIEIGLKNYLEKISVFEHEIEQTDIDTESLPSSFRVEIIKLLMDSKYEETINLTFSMFNTTREEFLQLYSCVDIIKFYKTLFFEYVSGKIISSEINQKNNLESLDPTENASKIKLCYLKDSLAFSRMITSSISTIYKLLQSDTISDIVEIIQFIVTVYKYGLAPLGETIDHILPLIWTSEASLKSTVIEALTSVLNFTCKQLQTTFIDNIFTLLDSASNGMISAIEEYILHLSEKDCLPSDIIKKAWNIFSNWEISENQRANAITLLGMISRGQPSVMSQNIELVTSHAFLKTSHIKLAISSCNAIILYASSFQSQNENHRPRLDNSDCIFRKIHSYLLSSNATSCSLWSIICGQYIKIITLFADRPFLLYNSLIKSLLSKTQFENKNDSDFSQICSIQLGRLLYAVGHVAASMVFLLEGDFSVEVKRRSSCIQKMDEQRNSLLTSQIDADQNEEEMYVQGPLADDIEVDLVRDLCEHKILKDDNLISKFLPIVDHIIKNNSAFPDHLVAAASLTHSKLILLSSLYGNNRLKTMFALLKESPFEAVRLNIIIMVGDIIQRFPNLIEPWIPNVFSALRDRSTNVRLTVISILSSLILNDMVKVKGHISELVLCIEDPDLVVSARTKLFFEELSRKDNAIYNILPDVISRLSDARNSLSAGLFERVMKFMLKFLQKEKQCESLVEKLCHRFSIAKNTEEVIDIVFCLQQLNLGERSFKRLNECFPFFKDKIYDDQVYDGFINVLTKFRKSSRDEAKNMIEDFEKRLASAHSRGQSDDNPLQCELDRQSIAAQDVSMSTRELSVAATPRLIRTVNHATSSIKRSTQKPSNKRNRTLKKVLAFNPDDTESDSIIPTKM